MNQYRNLILRYAFYDTLPRKEEYDVEHLESALEAEADFFLTDDDVFIRRVNRAAERYNAFAYQRANEICMHPTEFPPVRAVSHVWADVNMNTLTFRGSVLMRSIFSGIQALCHI